MPTIHYVPAPDPRADIYSVYAYQQVTTVNADTDLDAIVFQIRNLTDLGLELAEKELHSESRYQRDQLIFSRSGMYATHRRNTIKVIRSVLALITQEMDYRTDPNNNPLPF